MSLALQVLEQLEILGVHMLPLWEEAHPVHPHFTTPKGNGGSSWLQACLVLLLQPKSAAHTDRHTFLGQRGDALVVSSAR